MKETKRNSPERRRLLAGAGTVGALAAAATVLPLQREQEGRSGPPQPPEQGGGYRETPHVLRYYQTART